MKNELKKTVRQLCEEVGTAAAEERMESLTDDLTGEYDKRVKAGMAELDAYRDVLKNIDKIREMLEALPKTDEDVERKEREVGRKNLERILSKISTCMWLCTVIVFVLATFAFDPKTSWLIFIWSFIGQSILGMVKKVNKGKPLKSVMKKDGKGIFWLVITLLYFVLSFSSGMWHITWLIFLVGALLQTFFGMLFGA